MDKEYTTDSMKDQKDDLLTQASKELPNVDMTKFDIFVIYGWTKSGSSYKKAWPKEAATSVKVDGKDITNVGINIMINTPIYKNIDLEGSDTYVRRVLPSNQWVTTMLNTFGLNSKANSLQCASTIAGSTERYTYPEDDRQKCESKDYGDPFDIMGSGGFATDLNCMSKIKLGWIKESELVEMTAAVNKLDIAKINPYSLKDSKKKCLVIYTPNFDITPNV